MRTPIKKAVRKFNRWLNAVPPAPTPAPVPFDNSYEWLDQNFRAVMQDPLAARRPQYVWGLLQGAALAKVLGLPRVSAIEFGVASGAGLLSMERIAEHCEQRIGLQVEVFGFDTGTGYPKPADYRDMPYRWFEGYYPCDRAELQSRLTRATMIYGLISETVETFMAGGHPPAAFVGWDFNTYTGTRDGLRFFEGDERHLLPRTPCSFRSAVGKDCCEFTGELLAMSEFNATHAQRKISAIPGLSFFVPPQSGHWVGMLRTFHIFDHPLYAAPQSRTLSAVIDIDGRETYVDSRLGADLTKARAGASASKSNSQ